MSRDFSTWDAYIDGTPVLYVESGESPNLAVESVQLQPTRQDTGANPFEIRPDYGNFFAQGDFSRGALQQFFHREGSEPQRAFHMEGLDVFHTHSAEHGSAIHLMPLHVVSQNANVTGTPTKLEQADGFLFVANGVDVVRLSSASGAATAEATGLATNPITGLASSGSTLYACNGLEVRKRASGGTWAAWSTLDIIVMAFVKDRVIAATERQIYELTDAAPSPTTSIDTLPLGWKYTDIWEANGFVYASAVDTSSGLSRIHHFGLNDTGSAVEKIGSTPLPRNQLCYSGRGVLGQAYIGVGKVNTDGGLDPVLYQGIIDSDGFLNFAKIAEGSGSNARSLPVKAIEPNGETILVGWSLGTDAAFGAREGLAVLKPAVDGFANHLRRASRDGAADANAIEDIAIFMGKVVFITSAGFFYEDHAGGPASGEFVSSIADHNNFGTKLWDNIEISCHPLAAGASITTYYTTMTPADESWTLVGTLDADGASSANYPIEVSSTSLALRFTWTGDIEFTGFSVRSFPKPEKPEFIFTRTILLVDTARKDKHAEPIYQDVVDKYKTLQDLLHTKVVLEEPGPLTWDARVESYEDFQPAIPIHQDTSGDPDALAFYVTLQFVGTRR